VGANRELMTCCPELWAIRRSLLFGITQQTLSGAKLSRPPALSRYEISITMRGKSPGTCCWLRECMSVEGKCETVMRPHFGRFSSTQKPADGRRQKSGENSRGGRAASRKPWTSETIEKRYYEAMGRLEEDSRERRMLEAGRLRLSAK
jgi:hypothetical protein